MEEIKILQVLNSLGRGGIESFITGVYNYIDKSKVQFDFCICQGKETDHLDEVKKLGANVFFYPRFSPKNFFKFISWWKKFFSEHSEYKIIHAHVRSIAYFYLTQAHKKGLKTILHSHNTSSNSQVGKFANLIRTYLLNKIKNSNFIDYRFACSQDAGEWLFGKKSDFKVIHNGIETDKFKYNAFIRDEYRTKLGIENNFVIGHVGNGTEQKNHFFILKVFKEVLKNCSNAKLLLIGKLDRIEKEISSFIEEHNLQENILILGVRDDVHNLLQAMDVFIFPSLYEGLGIVAIEAQCSGLPVICSDRIPLETKITDNIEYISLDESIETWEQHILAYYDKKDREDCSLQCKQAGYDIQQIAIDLEKFYKDIYIK